VPIDAGSGLGSHNGLVWDARSLAPNVNSAACASASGIAEDYPHRCLFACELAGAERQLMSISQL